MRDVYEAIWRDHPEYRRYSPAVDGGALNRFVKRCTQHFKCSLPRLTIADVGCGCGRSAAWIDGVGAGPLLYDFADGCLDPEIAEKFGDVFTRCSVLDLPKNVADWTFSTDMLEHLPPEEIKPALVRLIESGRQGCYLEASTRPDGYGPRLVGKPLHLTVKPAEWWVEQLTDVVSKRFDVWGVETWTGTGGVGVSMRVVRV